MLAASLEVRSAVVYATLIVIIVFLPIFCSVGSGAWRELALPRLRGKAVLLLGLLLMLAVGGFFSIAAVDATIGSFASGAASEILLWPRYLFWAPGALALLVFTAYVALKLAVLLTGAGPQPDHPPAARS